MVGTIVVIIMLLSPFLQSRSYKMGVSLSLLMTLNRKPEWILYRNGFASENVVTLLLSDSGNWPNLNEVMSEKIV